MSHIESQSIHQQADTIGSYHIESLSHYSIEIFALDWFTLMADEWDYFSSSQWDQFTGYPSIEGSDHVEAVSVSTGIE